MILSLLFLAVAQPPAEDVFDSTEAAPAETLKIDILIKQPATKCEAKSGDEIVVCAEQEDPELHRLRPIPNAARYEKDESKAEFSIGEDATMLAEGEAAGLPQGVQSNRLMLRIKTKF